MKRSSLILLLMLTGTLVIAQQRVVVIEIRKEIDPRMNRYVRMGIDYATETRANAIVIDMDTYGGVLTDAKEIVDMIMKVEVPVWVYINSDAASAGALISIACDSIYMSPGASIGAATVVTMEGEKAPDKYQSYMRSVMRSTAEVNKRNPSIAEGMVDEALEIPGVKKVGQVITFSTSEALKYGFCDGQVNSLAEVLALNNYTTANVDRYEYGVIDYIVDFFMNPFLSGVLLSLVIAGIYFELQSPGAIIPAALAIAALILYLIPYYLTGLAEYWEVLALLIGIFLLALEIFVIPGFGIAGITGIILLVGSLVLIMINNRDLDFEFVRMNDVLTALATVLLSLLTGTILMFTLGVRLMESRLMGRMVLKDAQNSSEGYSVGKFQENLVNRTAIAFTELRPSGKILLDNQVVDAYTRTGYIEKGKTVIIVSQEGVSLLVREQA